MVPAWTEIAGFLLPPDFLPIADAASGDFLGVFLDAKLLARGRAPVVLYFHEQDPTYTWAFESVAMLRRAFDAIASGASWSEALRGQCDDEVRAALDELNDFGAHDHGDTPREPHKPHGANGGASAAYASREASRRWLRDASAAFEDPATLEAYRRDDHRYAVEHLAAQKIWVDEDA